RAACGQRLAEVGEREPRVDDVLDQQHVTVGEIEVEVLHDPDDAAGAGGRAVRRHRHEVDLDGDVDGSYEVGHEDEGALEDADEERITVGVVGGDLLAELGDAPPEVVFGDDDGAELRVVAHAGTV